MMNGQQEGKLFVQSDKQEFMEAMLTMLPTRKEAIELVHDGLLNHYAQQKTYAIIIMD